MANSKSRNKSDADASNVSDKNLSEKSGDRMSATLVVIYNHYLPDNIEKIEYVYNKRFSKIYHLLPLSWNEYKGLDEYEANKLSCGARVRQDKTSKNHKFPDNIIRVGGDSFDHQAYFVQGYEHYKNKTDHYLFVQDDVMLHPKINEYNYHEFFNLSKGDGYIERIINLNNYGSLLPWKENINYIIAREQQLNEGKVLKPSMLNYLRHSLRINRLLEWESAHHSYKFYISEQELDRRDGVASYDEAISLFKEHGLPTMHIDKKQAAKRTKRTTEYGKRSHLNPNHPIHSIVADNHKQSDLADKGLTVSEPGKYSMRNFIKNLKKTEIIAEIRKTYYISLEIASYLIYYLEVLRAILRFCLTGKDTYRSNKLTYPFTTSPTDIFIVPERAMPRFLAQCDLFAGLNCETAIPTSLLLSTQKPSEQRIVQAADLARKKYNYIVDNTENNWNNMPAFVSKSKTIDAVMSNWQDDYIYAHPVKLSSLPKK